ncbi:MAG: AAA family ATPase [Flexilinea sp.]|nr:AAA family ATPase [Flexilinea sp.]
MDIRTALDQNTKLNFGPGILYTIKGEAGRGGSCIVYDALYQTNAGDSKLVRIKECYPFDIPLNRESSGALSCPDAAEDKFADARAEMYDDFRLCNRLFYAEAASDAIINTINIYEANHTVYVVSAWSRENVLSSLDLKSLRDCVSVVRQTASAISAIHKAGYLYLDIKPDNISVINGISKRVQLFDFDSLIPLTALKEKTGSLLSYTKGFAALELRRGQFSKLGFHTDIYGIGALMFYLIFGRTPEAPDCVQGAGYDFTKMRFSGSFPDKLFLHLENFFRKTLAAFPPDRWQHMDDVSRELEIIEKLADPVYPYLVSTPLNAPAYFIGRSAEMDALETWFENDSQQNLFVSGMGGIGKSTLIQSFLAKHRGEWDSVLFLYYRSSLLQTITDDDHLRINGTERFPEEKKADYFERKLRKIREILARDRVLLVIDNFENHHDPDLSRILELSCRKIFITRQPFGSLNLPTLKLDAIQDKEDLLRLFIHYLDRDVSDVETEVIRTIIQQLSGHTLAIELFARQISNSFLSLPEASELLRKQGLLHAGSERVDYLRDNRISYEQLEAIITRLFNTDSLLEKQISLLKAAALFPAPGIDPKELMRLTGVNDTGIIHQLIRFGWITQTSGHRSLTTDHRIFLHPLIRDVIRDLPGTAATLSGANHVLDTLHLEITSESHKEEINLYNITGTVPSRDCHHSPDDSPDPYEIITDHRKLDHSVTVARGVIDALSNDTQLEGSPPAQKLYQAMVINLPKHEDEAILRYGKQLLDHPAHLSPLEILEVVEVVEKALLERQDYDAAAQLMESAEQYAVDERTKAEFCSLMGNIYDYRNAPEDLEKILFWLEEGIGHARLAPPPERKHLLVEFLLGKLNILTRSGSEDDTGIEGLIRELMDIIEKECLPYSEIRCGFATAMGFYWAELGQDRKETDDWVAIARGIGEKLYPAGLDFIDNCIIPPAIMYLDIEEYDASEAALREGIKICDDHPDLIAYQRKKHDLHRYLLDVFLYAKDYTQGKVLLSWLDEDRRKLGIPDTVDPTAREYLENL